MFKPPWQLAAEYNHQSRLLNGATTTRRYRPSELYQLQQEAKEITEQKKEKRQQAKDVLFGQWEEPIKRNLKPKKKREIDYAKLNGMLGGAL